VQDPTDFPPRPARDQVHRRHRLFPPFLMVPFLSENAEPLVLRSSPDQRPYLCEIAISHHRVFSSFLSSGPRTNPNKRMQSPLPSCRPVPPVSRHRLPPMFPLNPSAPPLTTTFHLKSSTVPFFVTSRRPSNAPSGNSTPHSPPLPFKPTIRTACTNYRDRPPSPSKFSFLHSQPLPVSFQSSSSPHLPFQRPADEASVADTKFHRRRHPKAPSIIVSSASSYLVFLLAPPMPVVHRFINFSAPAKLEIITREVLRIFCFLMSQSFFQVSPHILRSYVQALSEDFGSDLTLFNNPVLSCSCVQSASSFLSRSLESMSSFSHVRMLWDSCRPHWGFLS